MTVELSAGQLKINKNVVDVGFISIQSIFIGKEFFQYHTVNFKSDIIPNMQELGHWHHYSPPGGKCWIKILVYGKSLLDGSGERDPFTTGRVHNVHRL